MFRTLYVLVYPSRLFAAHWSFWIPYVDASGQESRVGDRIHVTGNRLHGFEYEYIREYNAQEDERKPHSFAIGLLPAEYLTTEADTAWAAPGAGAPATGPFNRLDKALREVAPPGPSLNKVAAMSVSTATALPPEKTEVRDCQWWIKQAVTHLVTTNLLLPLDAAQGGGTPDEIVEKLPRH